MDDIEKIVLLVKAALSENKHNTNTLICPQITKAYLPKMGQKLNRTAIEHTWN